jgi:hypothetical protein
METEPVSETLCFLVFIILDDGKVPQTVILSIIHHRQNPLDYMYETHYSYRIGYIAVSQKNKQTNKQTNKNKLRVLSPLTNYIDRETAVCQRS